MDACMRKTRNQKVCKDFILYIWIIIDPPVRSALVQIKLGTLFAAILPTSRSPMWSSSWDSWCSPRQPAFDSRYGSQQFFTPKQHDRIIFSEIQSFNWILLPALSILTCGICEGEWTGDLKIIYLPYTTWKVGKIFNQLLLNFLLNRNSLRSFRNRVVEDFTQLIDST